MKHFALILLAALTLLGATAQTTFNVDMNCAPEGFENVFVTGPWCGWCANDTYNTMTDPDGDGVYTVEVPDLAGVVEYKYAINGFADQENLVNDMVEGATCAPITDYSAYANRQIEAGSVASDYYGTCDGTCNEFPPAPGCTDAAACNYDESATYDDGSCTSECPGCTVSIACNYDDSATLDDGSCVFYCPGCTNPDACNFDSGALQDDGSCLFPEDLGQCNCDGGAIDAIGVCGGDCLEDADLDGICDVEDDCIGEFDECGVCNGAGAVYDCGCEPWGDGACDCEGTLYDQCGVCGGDGSSCVGCTYPEACNYDPAATILDASLCEFGNCPGCTLIGACNYNPTVSEDDGSCEWCSCLESGDVGGSWQGEGAYTLTVEGFPAVQEGLTTYRFYVNMENATDRLSAVYGNHEAGMFINTPDGAHNSAFNSSWNASGINPAFLVSFPELADDTYATIGLTGPASTSGVTNAADPSIVQDAAQQITPYFLTPGATALESTTLTGSSWYVISTAGNGLPDENMQVLILQVTTAGGVSGALNYQVFPFGLGENNTLVSTNFDVNFSSSLGGCTDAEAANYCPQAQVDDGSCFDEYIGCTDPAACNYSSTATVNDESLCIYPTPWVCDCQGGYPGCLDPLGCNFDPDASCEDLCIYPDLCGICGCGNCYPACTDTAACNYDPYAACDDGTCEYPEEGYNCEGQCLEALENPGCECYDYDCPSCDLLDLLPPGCSDPIACNYDPNWNCLAQSCEYPVVGACDCAGNVLDALGVCGGNCPLDYNQNGICDTEELGSGTCGPESCGPGTIWDEETQACIVAYPSDSNFDGCVQLNDLLDLLTAYGLCQVVEAPFSCGEPVSYQGYDYETVQIGEQCWFAENLRNENYDNGDVIPAGLSDSEWSSTTSGATAVYGEDAGCDDFPYSPDIDACDPAQSLNEYGRLYNWYAVDDARGLCPSGWHVPTDGDWMTMEMALGLSELEANSNGLRGTDQGTQIKTTYGWYGGGNGTNSSGFSGLPGGYRDSNDGYFYFVGLNGFWWSSSPVESDAWLRYLYNNREDVGRGYFNSGRGGFSVRCVRDTE